MKIELQHIKPETTSSDEKWTAHISDKEFYSILKITEVEYNAYVYLQSQLKEKDIIISEYHTKMLSDKESYFEVVGAHYELEAENKKLKEASAILNSLSEEKTCPACSNKMDYKPRIYHCGHCGSDFN